MYGTMNLNFNFYFMNIVVSEVTKLWAGWTRARIPVGATGKIKVSSENVHTGSVGQPTFHSMCRRSFSPEIKRPERDRNLNLHQVSRLRMSGTLSPLILYAFMACIGTTLFSYQGVWDDRGVYSIC